MIIFNCRLATKVTRAFLLQENMYELSELNTLKPRNKTMISSTVLKR